MMHLRNIRFAAISCTCLVLVMMPWSASVAEEMESAEVKIARAISAAPAEISDDATVMDVDGTVLREGSNGWTCLPNTFPGDKAPQLYMFFGEPAMKVKGLFIKRVDQIIHLRVRRIIFLQQPG